jgi:SAM-dependent methyltransferase
MSRYHNLSLSAEDIEQQTYKKYFGGGADQWETRGAFQLYLLKRMGLQPFHTILDVGCGPIRGGKHLIRYLNKGNYCGTDFNQDLIRAAHDIVGRDPALEQKDPSLLHVDKFEFSRIRSYFDYVLVFSVLAQCPEQRNLFFLNLPVLLKRTTKIYITHAECIDDSIISDSQLTVSRKMSHPNDIEPNLMLTTWGWDDERMMPILELCLK